MNNVIFYKCLLFWQCHANQDAEQCIIGALLLSKVYRFDLEVIITIGVVATTRGHNWFSSFFLIWYVQSLGKKRQS